MLLEELLIVNSYAYAFVSDLEFRLKFGKIIGLGIKKSVATKATTDLLIIPGNSLIYPSSYLKGSSGGIILQKLSVLNVLYLK